MDSVGKNGWFDSAKRMANFTDFGRNCSKHLRQFPNGIGAGGKRSFLRAGPDPGKRVKSKRYIKSGRYKHKFYGVLVKNAGIEFKST